MAKYASCVRSKVHFLLYELVLAFRILLNSLVWLILDGGYVKGKSIHLAVNI